MIKNIKMLLLVSLTVVACSKKDDDVVINNTSDGLPLTAGSADFSKYVAVGNSLSAGYSDGGLFIEGQKTSWTAILADQFKLVGGGEYKIPYMSDNVGGFAGVPPVPQLASLKDTRFYLDRCGPNRVGDIPTTVFGASIAAAGKYNNVGIPGAKCIDVVKQGYPNPYFGRIATANTDSMLSYAKSQNPTFFSLWIGNNDVLSYALAGGDSTLAQITPMAGIPGTGFEESYNEIINGMSSNGTVKGVVANIPYVTTIPNFTTISVTPIEPFRIYKDANEDCALTYDLSPTDIATINDINMKLLGPLKQVLSALGEPDRIQLLSLTSANPLLIKDENLDDKGPLITLAIQNTPALAPFVPLATYFGLAYGKARHSKTGDLIPLATRGAIGIDIPLSPGVPATLGKNGVTFPMADRFILIPSEILELKNATDTFNAHIKMKATEKGLAFVDANAILTTVATTGITANNFTVRSTFATGGAFSLDGVHPSPRGYALIANEFMKSINAKYGSNLKAVDLGKYRILFARSL